jgi:predicted GNAT family acetyltransferase
MTPIQAVCETTNAVAYGATIAPLVAADPVLTSVVATNLRREIDHPGTFADACWMWIEGLDGTAIAAAMHTPPWPPHLASDDPEVGAAVAAFLAASERTVTGVGGRRPAAEAFARHWAAARSCHLVVRREEGIYEATHVVPPSGVSGSLRRAHPGDAQQLNTWAKGFVSDTGGAVPDKEDLLTDRIGAGDMWIWQDQDLPVSMAYASPPEGGVSRISWVYTPPKFRQRGHASAVVAGVTTVRLDAGVRCMLYTDLANPTSNSIYQAIGYRRVGDGVTLTFEPPLAHFTAVRPERLTPGE